MTLRSQRAPWFATGVLLLLFIAATFVYRQQQGFTYHLSPAATKLVGTSTAAPLGQLKYDSKAKAHTLEGQVPDSNSLHMGTTSYSASLPDSAAKGVSLTDPVSKISMSFAPQFKTGLGKLLDGRMLYPLPNYKNAQLVYTLKNNGIEENLVLNKAPRKDAASFSYKLNLPAGLEARQLADGSIGIYGGDSVLYSNMSYGTAADKALVDRAKQNSAKTQLLYVIPRPVIRGGGQSRASFKLSGKSLSVNVVGLRNASYPLAIDPSLVLVSGSDWAQGGDDDGNIDYSNAAQISRAALGGATLSSWTGTGTGLTARYAAGAAVYNGYIYVAGGCITQTGTSCTAITTSVQKAPISSSGIGAWSTETALPQTLWKHNLFAYNGYLYAIAGAYNTTQNGTTYNPYVKINPNGSLGSTWSITANSLTGVLNPSSVVVNDYLYTAGGQGSGTVFNNVYYQKINSDGSVPANTSTTSLGTAVWGASIAYANGYIYVTGGCTSSDCTSYTNIVQFAKVNADGTLGSWSTTSSFATARYNHVTWVSNGYLYIAAGQASGALGDVQYAPIYANGSIGGWNTTTSLGTTRASSGSAVVNGYLYTVGGLNGTTILSTSEYAKIDGAGTIRNQLAGTSLPTPVWGAGTFVYKGFIYVVGGCTVAPVYLLNALQPCLAANIIGHGADTLHAQGTSGDRLTIQFAHLNSNGSIDTTYTISGYTATNGWFTDKAPCTEGLPTKPDVCPGSRYAFGGVFHGGRYWVVSGRGGDGDGTSNGNSLTVDANYFTPNNDGTPGTWLTGSNANNASCLAGGGLNTAREFPSVTLLSNFWSGLQVIGGRDSSGTPLTSVEQGGISYVGSSGNACGWLNNSQALPTALWQAATFSYMGALYVVGGRGSGSTYSGAIYKEASSNAAWTTVCSSCSGLPSSFYGGNAYAYRGRVYVIGGVTNGTDGPPSAYSTAIYSATIDSTGAIGTFSAVPATLSAGRYLGSVDYDAYHNVLYAVAGVGASGLTAGTDYFPINEGGPGTLSWSASSSDATNTRAGMATAQYNNFVYLVGGFNGSYLNTVQLGTIDKSSGSVTWSSNEGNTLPVNMAYGQAFVANGYLYAVGGRQDDTAGADVTTKIYRAPINTSTGHLTGAFVDLDTISPTNTMHMTVPREGFGLTVANGYVYIISGRGWPGGTETEEQDYEYAAINSDGTLGSFTEAAGGSNQRRAFGLQATSANGYIYTSDSETVGSCTPTCSVYTSEGNLMVVNADHTLTFKSTALVQDNYSVGQGIAMYNGYIYHAGGGSQSGGSIGAVVEETPIVDTGDVSRTSSQYSPDMPTIRFMPSVFAYNGRIYTVGGCQASTDRAQNGGTLHRVACSGSYLSTENHADTQSIPRVAHYARLLNFDANVTPVKYATLNSPASSYTTISSAYATSCSTDNVIGSPTSISPLVSDQMYRNLTVTNGCTSGLINSVYLSFTLDDTGIAGFPDTTTGLSNISSVQLYYHPNSGMRLRGGATFNSSKLQSLDAP